MTRAEIKGLRTLPGGVVVAILHGADPTGRCSGIEVLVLASSRSEALSRGRALDGLAPSLSIFTEPTDEDVAMAEANPEMLLWRRWEDQIEADWRRLDELVAE